MNLFPSLEKVYTKDQLSAKDAQRYAELIAFAPMVFQVSRLMLKFGIFESLLESKDGMTAKEVAQKAGISEYAAKILLEASLSSKTVIVDTETDKYNITKTGYFLLRDPATRANFDFNHDVNYIGLFKLEESLKEGRPAGLEHFGPWSTLYEALSSLPEHVQKSWFGFDHFYSDESFDSALKIVFDMNPKNILDVGGNTGKWALRCVDYDKDVNVTIMDLPQQIGLMRKNTEGKAGADRIHGVAGNLLDPSTQMPSDPHFDVIWMSQFLDCFSEDEITSILKRTSAIMGDDTRLFIMETFWDRQKYETASLCLTMTSVYFTALANGNSKMYHSDDMLKCVKEAGLEVETIHDGIGQGHSIVVCKKASE
ncbi:MAG: class I SAM-dependent methyltransferase [Bacteroidales bacterium]|nr:class I SAM-dependent methyltransferase [Bacteroidales bacterium]